MLAFVLRLSSKGKGRCPSRPKHSSSIFCDDDIFLRKALFFHYPRRAFKHTGQKKIFSALQVNTALCKTIEKTLLKKLAKIIFLDVDDTAWYAQETRNKGVEIHDTELEG